MGKKHNWVMVSAGVYDAVYKCSICDQLFFEQSDNNDSNPPKKGCIARDFVANKLIASGSRPIDVVDFNGNMAIYGDDEGCVIITKEQAIKFFGLRKE